MKKASPGGMSKQEVADLIAGTSCASSKVTGRLGMSTRIVDSQVENAHRKLDVRSAAAVMRAMRLRILGGA